MLEPEQQPSQTGLNAESNHARLLELLAGATRKLNDLREPQALMDQAVKDLHENFGFDLICCLTVEKSGLVLRAMRGVLAVPFQLGDPIPAGQGLVGQAGQTGQRQFARGKVTEIAIPLRTRDKVIGVLDAQSERGDAFQPFNINLLETIAASLAANLHSSLLAVELKAQDRLTRALQRISVAANASLDLSTVLETVCGEISIALDVDEVEVWLLEDDAETLQLTILHSPQPHAILGERLSLSDPSSVVAQAARENRSVAVNKIQHAADGSSRLKHVSEAQALLAVPIFKDGQPFGVLALTDSRKPDRFDETEAVAAALLGNHLAVAINNARRFARTERRAAQLSLLYDVSQQTSTSLDETEILQRIMTAVVERFKFVEAAVLVPASQDDLELVAFATSDDTEMGPGFRQKAGAGIVGHVAQTRATYLAKDTSNDPYYFTVTGHKTGSALGIPILREGALLGVFYVENVGIGTLGPEDVLVMEALSGHIATAMENTRLFARANDRLRGMRALQSLSRAVASSLEPTEIFQTVVRLLHVAFGYKYVAVGLLENDIVYVGAQIGYPTDSAIMKISITTGVTGRAVRAGQTQFVKNVAADPDFIKAVPDIESEICIPLLKDQIVLGVLDVSSTPNRPLTEADLDLLTLFAGQVTVAIDNAQLYKNSQRRAGMMAALHANSLDMAVAHDLQTLLYTIVERAAKLLQAPSGGLYLCDSERQEVRCVVSYNTAHDFTGTVLKYGEGAAGQVAATGQPLIIDDYRTWPGRAAIYEKAQPFISVLSVPIIWKEQAIGVIHVEHHTQANFFTQDDLSLMILFSNQAAVAVENARLLAETNRTAEEQRLLFNATRDFTAGLAEDDVLRAIARHMFNVIHTVECNIIRWDRPNNRLISLVDYNGKNFDVSDVPEADTNLANYPATRHVLESRQPLVVYADDPQSDPAERALLKRYGYSSLLMVPLIASEQSLGVVELFRGPAQTAFSASDIQLAQGLAAQATVALENAHLHATVKEQVHDLDALLTANTALLSTLELDPLLHNILSAAIDTIRAAEKGTILLVDPPSGQLQIRAVSGYTDPRVTNLAFASNDGYGAKTVREKRPLLITDARSDSSIRYDGDIPEVLGIHSAIVAPLIFEESLLGAIALDSTQRSAFTLTDLNLLAAFAKTAAASINHARVHAEAQSLAATDGHTGLANRRAFDRALTLELNRAERYGYPLSLIILDIDSFKIYNDTYGHPAGDERIKALADLLRSNLRDMDNAARYGGEEFAVILPHTDKTGAVALAERIRVAAEASAPGPHPPNQPIPGYTVSLGVATFPSDGYTPSGLLLVADNAELASKRAGKNRVSSALVTADIRP